MSEGPFFDGNDLLPPTLTATALAEELAEYEAALAAVHFEGSFDEVSSFEPFESQAAFSEEVGSRTTLPYPPTAAASGAFAVGFHSHVDIAKAVHLLDEEVEEEVPPTMRSPSSANLTVNERPVRVTMDDEAPTSIRESHVSLPAVSSVNMASMTSVKVASVKVA